MKFAEADGTPQKSGELALKIYQMIGEWVQEEYGLKREARWSLDAYNVIMIAIARVTTFYAAQLNIASPSDGELGSGWKVLALMEDLVKKLMPQQEKVLRAYYTQPRM